MRETYTVGMNQCLCSTELHHTMQAPNAHYHKDTIHPTPLSSLANLDPAAAIMLILVQVNK